MTATYHVLDRVALSRRAWDEFVDVSDDAWLWHRYDLQDALSTWPGRADASFAIEDGRDRILAVMPLHIISWTRMRTLRRSRIESLGGLACINSLSSKEQAKIFKVALAHIGSLAHKGCQGLHVSLSPTAPSLRGKYCPMVNPLVLHGFENTLTQTWVVDLRVPEDSLWQRMKGRARTVVRKAQKHGVTVRRADSLSDLDSYYRLHCETYKRSGIGPHPRAYFEAIWRDFLSNGLAAIWFAEHDGEVVAAENFGVYKQAALYWTGAASQQGLALGANSLLQWSAMQAFQFEGMEWYETGEAFPAALPGKSRGLNDFKKSFGGSLYPYYKGWLGIDSVKALAEQHANES